MTHNTILLLTGVAATGRRGSIEQPIQLMPWQYSLAARPSLSPRKIEKKRGRV